MKLIAAIYKTAPGYIHRKIADTDVLVSVGSGVADFNGYIELNSSASFLWELLKNGCSEEVLQTSLQQEFSIDADTARDDVNDFLNSLKEHEMVVIV